MSQSHELTMSYLTPEHFNVAASLLFQAYRGDRLMRKVLHFDENHVDEFEKKLRALIREELHSFWQTKQPLLGLFVDGSLKAICCAFQSDTQLQAKRFWHWRLKLMLSAGFLQTNQLIEKEDTIRNALKTFGRYFFVALIAVEPRHQGQGLGRALLTGVLNQAHEDINNQGVAVFVTKDDQRAFFIQEGFEVLQTLHFSKVEGELMFKRLHEA